MNRAFQQRGLSLFELMIALAVVGVLSAVAIPVYRGYMDTAAMTRVTANFEQGVKVAQAEFTKVKTRAALGIASSVPDSTKGWVEVLNSQGVQAPGGGPAFIPSNNKKSERGDADTGAIGIRWQKKKARLQMWRPLYLGLNEMRADITSAGVEIKDQRSSDWEE